MTILRCIILMVDLASVYFLSLYAGHRETRVWVALMDLTGAQQE